VHTVDSNGCTVLHAASRRGHLGVVKLLLRRGADVDVLNKAGSSPAELALENGQAEVAEFISEYKANANTRNKLRSATLDTVEYGADNDGKDEAKVSLHTAAEEGNVDTVKSLLELGVDIDARDASNWTPLHEAAAKSKIDVVRLLIERHAEVDSRENGGWTPLHLSSRFGHLEVSRVLLDHGANVNARKRDYWTPMHLSAANGYLETVKLLLERGADVHAVNREGQTPYQESLAFGEIADFLREHGAGRSRFDRILYTSNARPDSLQF
jgi:ankyrin repeat protein